jgi:hypothetical protein
MKRRNRGRSSEFQAIRSLAAAVAALKCAER